MTTRLNKSDRRPWQYSMKTTPDMFKSLCCCRWCRDRFIVEFTGIETYLTGSVTRSSLVLPATQNMPAFHRYIRRDLCVFGIVMDPLHQFFQTIDMRQVSRSRAAIRTTILTMTSLPLTTRHITLAQTLIVKCMITCQMFHISLIQ